MIVVNSALRVRFALSSANFSVEFVRVLRVGGRQRDSLVGGVCSQLFPQKIFVV